MVWCIGEHGGDEGYNPNQDYQPFVEEFQGTDVSANSRFVLMYYGEDPTGEKEWTRVTQYFGQTGLLPHKMDKKYKSATRDKVKKFKPWENFAIEDYVDFEKCLFVVKTMKKDDPGEIFDDIEFKVKPSSQKKK